jgi:hypothetical protein
MRHENKYEETDKVISKKIMKELEGQLIPHMCPDCHGEGSYLSAYGEIQKCKNCNQTGTILIQY